MCKSSDINNIFQVILYTYFFFYLFNYCVGYAGYATIAGSARGATIAGSAECVTVADIYTYASVSMCTDTGMPISWCVSVPIVFYF